MALLYNSAMSYLAVEKKCEDELYLEAKSIVDSIKGLPSWMNKKQKAGFVAWKINPALFQLIYKIVSNIERIR